MQTLDCTTPIARHASLQASPPTIVREEGGRGVEETGWLAIDAQLNDWIYDPAAIVDYGAVPPTRMTIRRAREVASRLRGRNWPVPDLVVPDGSGGISFEYHSDGEFRDLTLQPNGDVWMTVLLNGKFMDRTRVMTVANWSDQRGKGHARWY